MRDATLCYLFRGGKVLLQKKAAGKFGEGKWNGPGGKIEKWEAPAASAVREVKEETNLDVRNLDQAGLLIFNEEGGEEFAVHVFRTEDFSGTPKESEEGELKWFPVDSLPFEEMWEDDRVWFPKVLSRDPFRGRFRFTKGFKKLIEYRMEKV